MAGCGGEEAPPPPPPGAEAPAPGGAPEPPGTGGEKNVSVDMKNIQYMPREVRVAPGGTVTWTNGDSPPHTVTKTDGPGEDFDSGTLQPGAKFQHKFDKRGRVNYHCEIHPNQVGVVVVE
jgi:plastocyanin